MVMYRHRLSVISPRHRGIFHRILYFEVSGMDDSALDIGTSVGASVGATAMVLLVFLLVLLFLYLKYT